jgi:hypothetical protein
MPLSLGLRLGLSASTSTLGWVPTAESSPAAVAFNGQQFALPAYGSELVTNGTFDTDVIGWTAAGGTPLVTWSSGSIRVENGAAAESVARQFFSVTPGKLYRFTANSTGGTSTAFSVDNNSSAHTYIIPTTVASGLSIERYFVAVGPECRVFVRTNSAVLGIVAIADNVSVREVMLGEMGTNLGASGYTMGTGGGTATATESPTGTLNIAGDGTNNGNGDKEFTGLTVGAHYRCVFLVATNACSFRVGTSQGGSQTVPVTTANVGVNTFEFTATATSHWVRFNRQTTGTAVISSITIAQWTPRPTLRSVSAANAIGANGEVIVLTGSSTTAKTYVGADGLIKNDLAADTPRWDFSNGKARLLLENASTNLLVRSAEFDNAAWIKSNASITANQIVAPDGTLTADLFNEGTATGAHYVYNTASLTSGTVYTASVFLKAGTARYISVRADDTTAGGSDWPWVTLDTQTGTISANTSVGSSSVTAFAGGWYRVTVTWTCGGTGLNAFLIAGDNSATPPIASNVAGTSYTGTSQTFYLWGAQVEAAAFASAYISTTSATVTRTIETARFSPLVEAIASLPGATLRVQGTALSAKVNQRIIGATSTLPILRADSVTASTIGTGTGSLTATSILPGPFGAAVALNSSGQSLSANAGSTTTSTTAANVRTQLYLARGATVDASNPYGDGYYNGFALWPFRVSGTNLPTVSVAPT